MELRHLRYFIAVAEQLHFARAAELLDISPPTLTVQIKELEASLQARLFNRTKRSVTLTSAGETFLQESRAVIERMELAVNAGRRAGRGEIGRVDIGYVGSAAFAGVLQAQVRGYRAAWPDVQVQVSELPMDDMPTLLEAGKVDVAFVRLPVALPTALSSHVVSRDHFCVALPAEHPLAHGQEPLPPRKLAAETFIVPEQDLGLREVAHRGKFTPLIGAVPGSLLSVLTHVSLGTGVAIVPDLLEDVIALPNVVYRPISGPPIASEVAAVFRKYERAPAVVQMIKQLRQAPPSDRQSDRRA